MLIKNAAHEVCFGVSQDPSWETVEQSLRDHVEEIQRSGNFIQAWMTDGTSVIITEGTDRQMN